MSHGDDGKADKTIGFFEVGVRGGMTARRKGLRRGLAGKVGAKVTHSEETETSRKKNKQREKIERRV